MGFHIEFQAGDSCMIRTMFSLTKNNDETYTEMLTKPSCEALGGMSPLHMIASGDTTDYLRRRYIKCLLDANHDPGLLSTDGSTALHYAVRSRCTDAIERLLNCDLVRVDAVNHRGETALMIASHNWDVEALLILFKYKPSVDITSKTTGCSCLHFAAMGLDSHAVDLVKSFPISIVYLGFFTATRRDHINSCEGRSIYED